MLDQHGNVTRVVLQVAVHGDDDVASGAVDACLHRSGLAKVALQAQSTDVWPDLGGVLAEAKPCAVGAAVIDDDQLPRPRVVAERSLNGVDQIGSEFDFVVHGHHHGQTVGRYSVGHGRGSHSAIVAIRSVGFWPA